MVKRYTGLYSQIEGKPPGAYFELLEPFVRASDYDAMDSAATALGTHVQFLEARVNEAVALLKEIQSDDELDQHTEPMLSHSLRERLDAFLAPAQPVDASNSWQTTTEEPTETWSQAPAQPGER